MGIAERFLEVFAGLDRAHGEYTVKDKKGDKSIGKAVTKKAPVDAELWEKHLSGKQGIGIVPIRDDSTCVFGAIDIDCYDGFDPSALSVRVSSNNWPLIICRSKSGGAHCYLFLSEPVQARIIRSKLKQFAITLGHGKAEIFPKQDKMFGLDDIGNWINMPYFGGDSTNRYAFDNGEVLSTEQFLDLAESCAIGSHELEDLEISSNEFSDAPPCIETLVFNGFPPGTRNNGLFNMAVYARMKYPDEWHKYVYEYNERYMGPGSAQEVAQVIKSVDKKKYTFKCTEAPICGVCDKSVCQDRKFSPMGEFSAYRVGTTARSARPCILDEVEQVVCYEAPENSDDECYWVFRIHGVEMDISVDMVQYQAKFIRAYLKKFHKMILAVDEAKWARSMNRLLANADIEQLAPDAGPEGQLFLHLEAFCTGKAQARVQEELLLGKPWTDNGKVYFRSNDLLKYLEMNRFKEFSQRQLYAVFRRHGAKHHKIMLKGKCVACWSMPEFNNDTVVVSTPSVITSEY